MKPAELKNNRTHVHEMSRLRRLLLALTCIGLGLLVGFAILEFGLARLYYSNINELRQDEFDAELGWRLKPGNYTVKGPQSFFTHTVFVNRFGIRHSELTDSHPTGTRRIIVLGDSFTFGASVDDDALFSTQLERRLNRSAPRGLSYEVINAGVPAYGTAQELILMKRLAKAGIIGDIYLVNIFTNDILDNLRLDYGSRSENLVQPGFELDSDGDLRFAHKPQRVLREGTNLVPAQQPPSSRLLSIVKSRLQVLAQTHPSLVTLARRLGIDVQVRRVPGVISAWYDDEILVKGVPLMKALLAEISVTVKNHGGVLLVSVIPSPMQVYPQTYGELLRTSFGDDPMVERFLKDPLRAQRIIHTMCEQLGVPLLDVYDALAGTKQPLYIPADGHFNEAGHAVFAESLEQFVKAHELR